MQRSNILAQLTFDWRSTTEICRRVTWGSIEVRQRLGELWSDHVIESRIDPRDPHERQWCLRILGMFRLGDKVLTEHGDVGVVISTEGRKAWVQWGVPVPGRVVGMWCEFAKLEKVDA